MRIFLFIIVSSFVINAQQYQLNDPYPTASITLEINFTVDKYYPIFGTSEKPHTSERLIKLTDRDGNYSAYLHFSNNYNSPQHNTRSKTLRFYYPDSYYDYIRIRLDNDEAFVVYREYKDGHKWGEIYFNKYP